MAQTRKNLKARVTGSKRLDRAALLRSTALQAVFVLTLLLPGMKGHAQPAPNARPQGGAVVAGSASIAATANTTTINQTSQRTAITWTGFDVGSNQAVQFNQPNSGAIALNRVTGSDPSQIAGRITANGTIVLVNPSGVVFSQGAQVNAQSVLITTADVSTQNFMNGKLVFDTPGKANAMIVNRGTITVAQAGLAGLVAPGVANSGVINARMGKVVLAGAATHTVDLYGDGMMSIDVTKQVTQAPVGPDGKTVSALVTNTGTIRVDGGNVVLTASAVDGIVSTLIDAGGKISANTTASGRSGTIVLHGVGGSVTIEGDVSAAGRAAGTSGGAVQVLATDTVALGPTARLNVSGRAGGGTVALGTTLARASGGPAVVPTQTAKTVTVSAGAKVSANATRSGNGGKVVILSTDQTTMAGTLSATGGNSAGNGGFV